MYVSVHVYVLLCMFVYAYVCMYLCRVWAWNYVLSVSSTERYIIHTVCICVHTVCICTHALSTCIHTVCVYAYILNNMQTNLMICKQNLAWHAYTLYAWICMRSHVHRLFIYLCAFLQSRSIRGIMPAFMIKPLFTIYWRASHAYSLQVHFYSLTTYYSQQKHLTNFHA